MPRPHAPARLPGGVRSLNLREFAKRLVIELACPLDTAFDRLRPAGPLTRLSTAAVGVRHRSRGSGGFRYFGLNAHLPVYSPLFSRSHERAPGVDWLRSSQEMKYERLWPSRRRRLVNIMEQLTPVTKGRPTYRIPEWSSRAEEECICKEAVLLPERTTEMICAAVERCAGITWGRRYWRTGPLDEEARTQKRRFETVMAELESWNIRLFEHGPIRYDTRRRVENRWLGAGCPRI